MGGGRGKLKMSRTSKLDIACKHLARRQRTSITSTRAPGSDKKRSRVSDLAANRLLSYLHCSIANPATQKSTELNLGLKELRQFLGFYCLSKRIIWLNHQAFFISLLFIIVSSLNHFQLTPFMLNKVNVSLL